MNMENIKSRRRNESTRQLLHELTEPQQRHHDDDDYDGDLNLHTAFLDSEQVRERRGELTVHVKTESHSIKMWKLLP